MLLKVCGMTQGSQIEELDQKGIADLIGFIFYEPSPRSVRNASFDLQNAHKVGVFVNATFDEILDKVIAFRLDYVQLHGDEEPELCCALRTHTKIIKAFRIQDRMDHAELGTFEPYCDLFLFDTHTPNYGGSGMRFDWELLKDYRGDVPFLLSGGIDPESLEELRHFQHPKFHGIDINSRFEVNPGVKDIKLIQQFKKELSYENFIQTR